MHLPEVEKDIFQTILARRTVRSFCKNRVSKGVINNLLEAAVRAPTAMHQEPWGFAVIQDATMLKFLSDFSKPFITDEARKSGLKNAEHYLSLVEDSAFDVFYGADTLIIICGKTSAPFFTADCWLAAENLMLAACAMNLGSCVIGSAVIAINYSEIKQKLGIPEGFTVVAPIILGYPDKDSPPTSRKPPLVFEGVSVC